MSTDVTRLLNAIERGDQHATSELLPLIYSELRRLAARKLAKEPPGHTLQPTGLVHEAYLRLIGSDQRWKNQSHFLAAAAEAMRRILIENARKRHSFKRGGGMTRCELHESDVTIELDEPDALLDLDAALTKLAKTNPQLARLVEMRYFAGLSFEQVATALGISTRTAKRHWSYARAWLRREIDRDSVS